MNSVATLRATWVDDIARFEQENEARHRAMMCEEYLAEIQRRDEQLSAEHTRSCPSCGGRMHGHGKTKGCEVIISCGIIKVSLTRMRCSACGVLSVPASDLIPAGAISAPAAERMCDLAVKMSYAKAADSLRIQQGIELSDKKLWEAVQAEAESIDDVVAAQARKLYTTGEVPAHVDLGGEKPLVIGIDGGHIPHWQNELGRKSFEAKCVTIATGSERGPGKKRHLRDRVGYSADVDVGTFGERVSALAIACGYLSAKKTIFVSDGAAWIPALIDERFPGCIHLLDMYHLKHRIWTTFRKAPFGCNACYRDAALAQADAYDPLALLSVIGAWNPKVFSHRENQRDLLEYVTNNARAIAAHRRVDWIHGSGWIEKGVDLMISRRLKNRGMSWTRKGAIHMIAFEVLRYNKQWDVYWNQRKGLEPVSMAA